MTDIFYAGQRLRASLLQDLVDDHLRVTKPSLTTRSSTTTLADDPHLILTLKASYTYIIKWAIWYASGTTPDIKWAIRFPAGATVAWGGVRMVSSASPTGNVDAGAYVSAVSASDAFSAGGTGGVNIALLEATVAMSTTAGDCALQWAQNTSDPSGTTIGAGSSMTATRVR